jgi:hypothetical protein
MKIINWARNLRLNKITTTLKTYIVKHRLIQIKIRFTGKILRILAIRKYRNFISENILEPYLHKYLKKLKKNKL